jgi:hypothetical protein
MLPDDLDEIDRNLHIFKNGSNLQKLSILKNFTSLYNSNLRERFRDIILPFCLSIVQSESLPFQRDLAVQLMEVIHLLSVPKVQQIMQVSKQMVEHRNEGTKILRQTLQWHGRRYTLNASSGYQKRQLNSK